MSDPYKKFATETYNTIYTAMKDGIAQSGDLPLLFMSGERHEDPESKDKVSNAEQEPCMAAAYAHIAAIKSAEALVGKDNMVVSFEMDQEYIKDLQLFYAHDPSSYQEMTERYPMERALQYAFDHGYEVVASDPLFRTTIRHSSEARLDAEKDALGKIALRTENTPNIVVHVGGALHIGYLQGYTAEDLIENGHNLTRDDVCEPYYGECDIFDGIYGHSTFVNNLQFTSAEKENEISGSSNFHAYIQNPENAIQIDPPGKMKRASISNIEERIEAAAAERTALEHAKTGEDSTPTRNTEPVFKN